MYNCWGTMSNSLRTSLEAASIILKGTYPYLLHPLFDGFPSIQPALLNEVVCEMEKLIKKGDWNKFKELIKKVTGKDLK